MAMVGIPTAYAQEKTTAEWVKDLQSDVPENRMRALQALGDAGDPLALRPLLALVSGEQHPDVKSCAVRALSAFPDPRAVETVIDALRDPHPAIQQSAAEALSQFGAVAIDPLLAASNDPAPLVRTNVIRALSHFGWHSRVHAALLDIAEHDQDLTHQELALQGLFGYPDAASRALVMTRLSSSAPQVRAKAVGVLDSWLDPEVMPLLSTAVNDPDPAVRATAAVALGHLHCADAYPPLLTLLNDPVEWVRVAAVDGLCELHDVRARDVLPAMLNDPSPNVRIAACRAPAGLWPPTAFGTLQALLRDPHPAVRYQACRTLVSCRAITADALIDVIADSEQIGMHVGIAQAMVTLGAPGIERLITALDDPRPAVRQAASVTLCREPRAVPALMRAVTDNSDLAVRFNAIIGLGKLGDARAVPVLLALLQNPASFTKYTAEDIIQGLGTAGDARAIDPLLHLLATPPDFVRKDTVIVALAACDDPRVQDALAKIAEHETDETARIAALRVLAHREDKTAKWLPLFLDTLQKGTAEVRATAADILGRSPRPEAHRALLAVLSDRDWQVRGAAAGALGRYADTQDLYFLLATLRDPNLFVRMQGAEALSHFNYPRLIDALLPWLKDKRPITMPRFTTILPQQNHSSRALTIQTVAIEVLANTRDPRAIHPLLDLAMEGDSLPGELHDALIKLGAMAVVPLQNVLKDARPAARMRALTLLGEIGDVRAQPSLRAALLDPHRGIRAAATRALGGCGDMASANLLLTVLKDDPDWEVRLAAVTALGQLKDKRAVPALLTLAQNAQPFPAELFLPETAKALALIDDAGGLEALVKSMQNADERLQIALAVTLGELPDRQAVPALITLLRSTTGLPNAEAVSALESLTGQSFGADPEQWQTWWKKQHAGG